MTTKIPNYDHPDVEELSRADERNITNQDCKREEEENQLRAVVEHDDNAVKDGKLMSSVLNQGFSSFMPDMVFDQLTKDYAMSKQIFGETLLRLVTGYDPNYIKKNLNIPEFQRELDEKIKQKYEDLNKKGLLDKGGQITQQGLQLAALVMYSEELDSLMPKGFFGEKENKKINQYGTNESYRAYKKGDSYRDLALRRSIKQAIRRGHSKLHEGDLQVNEKQSKGSIHMVYAVDASGSMKGKKIEAAKKAGIALAYKAIEAKDNVGLLSFSTEIREKMMPTQNFNELLLKIAGLTAARETDLTSAIKETFNMFPKGNSTKHLTIITDGLPTIGTDPEKEALEAVSMARNQGITVSIVGINLDEKGQELAEKLIEIGQGKMYVIRDLNNLDTIILDDYYSLKQ